MKMIVGLGNPGTHYQGNRHNLGFMAIDHFAERNHISGFREQKQALSAKSTLMVKGEGVERTQDLLLVKPITYMNLSGHAIQQLMVFYKITLSDLLVITEDINLSFGAIKIRTKGGTGGHNGLKSIQQHLGQEYTRLRFGVGLDSRIPIEQYVLSDFPNQEKKRLPEYLKVIDEAIIDFVSGISPEQLMSRYNRGGE